VKIVVDLSGIKDPRALAELAAGFGEGVIAHNRYLLRLAKQAGITLPPVLASGIVFRDEPWAGLGMSRIAGAPATPIEEFAHYGLLLKRGWGDCMQICCARVAELREQGINAALRCYWRLPNPRDRFFHVQTRFPPWPRYPDDPKAGPIEDTSRLLRMI
jgi:hypothetical protein